MILVAFVVLGIFAYAYFSDKETCDNEWDEFKDDFKDNCLSFDDICPKIPENPKKTDTSLPDKEVVVPSETKIVPVKSGSDNVSSGDNTEDEYEII